MTNEKPHNEIIIFTIFKFFLLFKDNAKGYRSEGIEPFSYGFNLEAYYGDIIENPDKDVGGLLNQANDNCRVVIVDKINMASNPVKALEELNNIWSQVAGKMYDGANEQSAKEQNEASTKEKKDKNKDEIEDADFEVVD